MYYKCKKCNNISDFEEINIYKTCVHQENDEIKSTYDKYLCRENVICLECKSTFEDGDVTEVYEE